MDDICLLLIYPDLLDSDNVHKSYWANIAFLLNIY